MARSSIAEFYRAYDALLDAWPVDVVRTQVPTRFGTTRVNVCGPEDGPPVILLPGAGATSTAWFANIEELSRTRRVLAVDLMGDAGRSIADGEPLRTVDDVYEWLGEVLDHFSLDAPDLVAHSYGAMIGLGYAIRYPDRVRKLVLLDPNGCFARMRIGYLLRALPVLLRPTAQRWRNFVGWETDGRTLNANLLEVSALGVEHFSVGASVVPKRPRPAALSSSGVDLTVVLAERSKVHNSHRLAARIRKVLPEAEVVMLADATHHTVPAWPAAELNAILIEALR